MKIVTSVALLALSVSVAGVASAQSTPPAAGSDKVIPEKQSPNSLQDGRSDSLSTKLNKSNGVITPDSNIDPGMKVPAPDPRPSSMPVIPPSATDGSTAK